MESKDFEALIRGKVGEADLHAGEIQKSKSYVWTAVQNNIHREPRERKWLYLAAASVLLFLTFGSIFYFRMERNHQMEMSLLKDEIKQLNQLQAKQMEEIESKSEEMNKVYANLESLGQELQEKDSEVLQEKPIAIEAGQRLVRYDTVVIEKTVIQYAEQSKVEEEKMVEESIKPKTDYSHVVLYKQSKRRAMKFPEENRFNLKLAQLSK